MTRQSTKPPTTHLNWREEHLFHLIDFKGRFFCFSIDTGLDGDKTEDLFLFVKETRGTEITGRIVEVSDHPTYPDLLKIDSVSEELTTITLQDIVDIGDQGQERLDCVKDFLRNKYNI